MTDQQIQDNADRAHQDSVNMLAAVTRQAVAMEQASALQQQLIDLVKAQQPGDPITIGDVIDLVKVLLAKPA